MDATLGTVFGLVAILLLALTNGFFVATEFSLVTVRRTRIDQLVAEGHGLAKVVRQRTKTRARRVSRAA